MLGQHERLHRFHHRHLQPLPFAGAVAVVQCGEDGVDDGQATHLVGHDRRGDRRFAVAEEERVGQTGSRLDDIVVGGPVGVGSIGGPSLRLAEDDLRIAGTHIVVGETQPPERARSQVGDDDVARLGQAQKRLAAIGVLEIERDVAFVAQQVQRHPGELRVRAGAHEAIGVAGDVLDADDVGAEVAEDLRGQRTHHHRGQVEHPHIREGTTHGVTRDQ